MIFEARDAVLGGPAGIGIDPFGDADLGLGFLQRFVGGELALGRPAGEAGGLGVAARDERAAQLAALALPVEAVRALENRLRAGFVARNRALLPPCHRSMLRQNRRAESSAMSQPR